jgi:hypothetical protein
VKPGILQQTQYLLANAGEAVSIKTAGRPKQAAMKESAVAPQICSSEQDKRTAVRPRGISVGQVYTKQH